MGEILALMEVSMDVPVLPVLRPLRLGELLDQAIRIYRRNFLTFLGIVALVYIPYALIVFAFSVPALMNVQHLQADRNYVMTLDYWLPVLGSVVILPLVSAILVSGLGSAALANAVLRNYFGLKTGILEAYQQIGPSLSKLFLTLVLFGLLVIAAFLWLVVPCVGWLTGIGPFVFLTAVVGPLLPAIVVIEKSGARKSISRIWDLARRRFWWLLGFAIVFYLFNTLVVTGPTSLISYFNGVALGKGEAMTATSLLPTIIASVASHLVNLLVLPLQLTAWTLVYVDLRVRTEGFDLALQTLTPSENAVADMSSLPTTAPTREWLTVDDIVKLLVVSFIGVGLYVLFVVVVFIAAFAIAGASRGGF
jgi:hypothetical protein